MISDRQVRLLKAIINEYIKTAEPVGSVEVVKKYSLKYSPATARNEMAKLLDLGFLQMLHSSSGRVPTAMAYRIYLESIMDQAELPVLQEVAMKQRLWPKRFEFDKLLRETTVSLSENTKELAFATDNDGYLVFSGAVNILDHREFWDIDVAKTALHILDRYELVTEILKKAPYGDRIKTIIGKEIGIENMENCAFAFTTYAVNNKNGFLGVFGPARLNYEKVIPSVRYAKRLIEELGESW